MARKKRRIHRLRYSEEFKTEAVHMLLDGHSAESVAENLGISGTNLIYRWKAKYLTDTTEETHFSASITFWRRSFY